MKTFPPRWNDERVVEKLAGSYIVSLGIEAERETQNERRSAKPKVESEGTIEDLLRRAPKTLKMRKFTWAEVREFATALLDEVRESTIRRRPRGRPRMTEAERRKASPVHDAADEVPLITPVLALLYSDRSRLELRRRAIEVAAARHRVNFETLLRYVRRPRKDRRRVFTL